VAQIIKRKLYILIRPGQGPKSSNLGPEAPRAESGPDHKEKVAYFSKARGGGLNPAIWAQRPPGPKVAQILKRKLYILVRPGAGA